MKTGVRKIDEQHDEIAAQMESIFKVMGRIGGKKLAVIKKWDAFLRTMKAHHEEEEVILQSLSGSLSHDLIAAHKKEHRRLEKRLKEVMEDLGENPEESDLLDLKREVRRLLAGHIVEWDLSAYGPRADKT